MTDYQRRTAAARRRTEARIELARELRAENRRRYGARVPYSSSRALALFPGFPPLVIPTYRPSKLHRSLTLADRRDAQYERSTA